MTARWWLLPLLLLLSWASVAARAPADPPSPPREAALTRLYQARAAGDAELESRLWLQLGDPVRGLEAAARALPVARDPALLTWIAAEATASGDPALAQAALERWLALDPADAGAHLALGILLAPVAPGQAAIHLQRAAQSPDLEAVALAINRAAQISPEAVGWALFERKLWPQAELAFTQAAANPALAAEALAALALSRDYQSKDGALWMARALAQSPENANVRAMQGIHLRLQGDLEGSLQALMIAADLAPESAPILAQLGAAWQQRGDLDEALRWYEQALARAGGDPRYQALVDSLLRTQDSALDAILEIPPVGAP
jgi:tetratricopeptide (TPR) repeat protein